MKPIYAKPKKIPTIPLSHPLEATPTATNHPTGDAFFKNQIATVSPQYDADVKTGRALELGVDNDLAIPIHNNGGANSFLTYHDIANDEIIQIGNAVDGGSSDNLEKVINGNFDNGEDGWALSNCTISGGNLVFDALAQTVEARQTPFVYDINKTYLAVIDITSLTQGSVSVKIGGGGSTYWTTSGVYSVVLPIGTLDNFQIAGNNYAISTIASVSVKEILPTSTEYILNDVTVNNILTHKMPFSAGDLNLIQQEPNLLAALALGEATPISSVTLDADDKYFPASEVN